MHGSVVTAMLSWLPDDFNLVPQVQAVSLPWSLSIYEVITCMKVTLNSLIHPSEHTIHQWKAIPSMCGKTVISILWWMSFENISTCIWAIYHSFSTLQIRTCPILINYLSSLLWVNLTAETDDRNLLLKRIAINEINLNWMNGAQIFIQNCLLIQMHTTF